MLDTDVRAPEVLGSTVPLALVRLPCVRLCMSVDVDVLGRLDAVALLWSDSSKTDWISLARVDGIVLSITEVSEA